MRKRIPMTITVTDPNPPEALRRALEQLAKEERRRQAERQKGGRT